ncbi:DUF5133 domain-containing protein [Streptomyces sp. NPDC058469]|uniref:DUF5133 domain-containing protein n=1 Tax=Streptomyces sp. NPDC058469 TaxID=3346514 RepID=UPI0036548AEE
MPSPARHDLDPTSPATPPERWRSRVMVPDPAVLRQAVDHYLALVAHGDPAVAVALRNAAYTLCVLTGTRTVEEAMSAVRVLCPVSATPAPPRPQTSMVPAAESGSGQTEAVS